MVVELTVIGWISSVFLVVPKDRLQSPWIFLTFNLKGNFL